MSTRSRSILLPICGGLLLGSTASWLVRSSTNALPQNGQTQGGPAALPSASFASTPAPGLVLPPKLAPAEAEAALDAWLALGAPADGSAPAPLATQERALRALLTVFSDAQFPRLLETLFARTGSVALSLRQTVVGIWLHRHPAAVTAWVLTADLPAEGQTRYHLARQIGMFWAGQDAVAAVAWAESISDPALSTGVLEMILPNLAPLDPARALALARARGPEFFAKIQDALFRNWAEADPEAALRELGPAMFAQPDTFTASRALGTWLARDPAAAMTWLSSESALEPSRRFDALQNSAFAMLQTTGANTDKLLDSIARLNEFPELQRYRATLLVNWHGSSPDAALAWLHRLPDAAARADLIDGMIPDYFIGNIIGADSFLNLALLLPDGPERDTHLSRLSATWVAKDPAAARTWLDAHRQSDPALARVADQAEGVLVAALAERDPAAALASYAALPEGGEARRAAVPALALAWARSDPGAALRWLAAELPPAPSGNHPLLQEKLSQRSDAGSPLEQTAQILPPALLRWSQQDPLAALQWAESQPDPFWRNVALTALSTLPNGRFPGANQPTYAAPDPIARADLLGRIADPAERKTHLDAHLSNWLARDYDAARAWIERHEVVSPEEAGRLLLAHDPFAP